MKSRIAVIVSGAAVVAMCAFIFCMSAQPADDSTAMSMGLVYRIIGFIVPGYDQMSPADQLYWQQALEHPIRKLAHFLEFAALGALMLNLVVRVVRLRGEGSGCVFQQPTVRLSAIAWGLTTAYAVTDEIHQVFVPGRTCKLTDVLIDSLGVLLGVVLAVLVFLLAKRMAKRP